MVQAAAISQWRRPGTVQALLGGMGVMSPDQPLLEASKRYGIGAYARQKGIVVKRRPGRSGLLAGLADLLSPVEVRARLVSILSSGRATATGDMLTSVVKSVDMARMGLVLRSYGSNIAHYFTNDAPGGGVVPVRAAIPRASGPALSKAAGRNYRADIVKLFQAFAVSEYQHIRNELAGPAVSASPPGARKKGGKAQGRRVTDVRDIRGDVINSRVLEGHTEWSTFSGCFPSLTADKPALFQGLRAIKSGYGYRERADKQAFVVPGTDKVMLMDKGLFIMVASGYEPDGTPTPKGRKPQRSTFYGSRVDVMPADPVSAPEFVRNLRREWGDALLADFRAATGDMSDNAFSEAVKKGYPLDMDEKGRPLARLLYGQRMLPGTDILLAWSQLGFTDNGRTADGKPTKNHPDELEIKFGTFKAYEDAVSRKAYPMAFKAAAPSEPVSKVASAPSFCLPFGQVHGHVNPDNTALVFSSGNSANFSVVHRSTGKQVEEASLISSISNLPIGKYMRVRSEDIEAWRKIPAETRGSLAAMSSGSVMVLDGQVMEHHDASGRKHNDFNGPSVVRAVQAEDGLENRIPLAWHHEGRQMGMEEFGKLRQNLNAQVPAEDMERQEVMENPFEPRPSRVSMSPG